MVQNPKKKPLRLKGEKMGLIDCIVIAVIVLIIGGAVAYIVKAKKSGKKCIGCPEGCSCGNKNTNRASGCGNCGKSCH